MNITESYIHNNRRILIIQDHDPESPREWDCLGTMACFHSRYTLGDNQYKEHYKFITDLMNDCDFDDADAGACIASFNEEEKEEYSEYSSDESGVDGCAKDYIYDVIDSDCGSDDLKTAILDRLIEVKKLVILPLNLYDHGGLSMSISGFSCPWDSGQVGWIYASGSDIRKNFLIKDGDEITDEIIERVTKNLIGEVKTYDQFLRGDIYGFIIQTYVRPGYSIIKLSEYDISNSEHQSLKEFEIEGEDFVKVIHEDSCWNFYGVDDAKAEAEGIADSLNDDEHKQDED